MNKIIKYKVICIFIIFIISFIVHFGYDIIKCDLTALFFPVNESIWEHMKMLFTTYIMYGFIEYFINRKRQLNIQNIIFNSLITSFITIFVFLLIFLPLYNHFGENLLITLIIELLSIAISQFISYFILIHRNLNLDKISIFIIIICYIVFGYLTYKPPLTGFFFDPIEEKYGINTYKL